MTPDVKFQLLVWGFADSGLRDPSACAAEERVNPHVVNTWLWRPIWDDQRRIEDVTINGGKPPEWWALPWVTEHKIRFESHPGAGDAASPPLAGDPAPAVTP